MCSNSHFTPALLAERDNDGISHNKIEDTKEEHLELAITAFDKLADKAMRWIAGRGD